MSFRDTWEVRDWSPIDGPWIAKMNLADDHPPIKGHESSGVIGWVWASGGELNNLASSGEMIEFRNIIASYYISHTSGLTVCERV